MPLSLLISTCIPVNRAFRNTPTGVPVYVVSNGFHTDLLLPLQQSTVGINWLAFLNNPAWVRQFADYQYVAFGWGNANFYLAYRGGHRPGLGKTMRALLPASTVMHVDFYRRPPHPGRHVAALHLSEIQYQQLATYIQASFARDSSGQLRPYPGIGMTAEDFFFAGIGHYSTLRTCNSWTNTGLRQAGIRAAWHPLLAPQVMQQVRKANEE